MTMLIGDVDHTKPRPWDYAGCGAHDCVICKPVGIGTNGGCRCPPTRVKRVFYLRGLEAAAQIVAAEEFTGTPEDRQSALATAACATPIQIMNATLATVKESIASKIRARKEQRP